MTDPYGRDYQGEAYLGSFLQGHFEFNLGNVADKARWGSMRGYRFVEVFDESTQSWTRVTGALKEVIRQPSPFYGRNYPITVTDFVLERRPINAPSARFEVTFADISTREQREHWIAGGSLKVIDRGSGEVLAERRGYLIDPAMGDTSGGREPWLRALDSACPAVQPRAVRPVFSRGQLLYRTAKFAEEVLVPAE